MAHDETAVLHLERVRLDTLHPDPSNARRHNARNIATIRASLKQFSQVEPLVVQKSSGRIIGGNGRYEAMQQMGMAEADVVMLDIGDTQATALGITLNRTAELAEWDLDVLDRLVATVRDEVPMADLGFDAAELDAVLSGGVGEAGRGSAEDVVEDDVPAPPDDPKTQVGDIWTLGEHRLLCGDSRLTDDVQRIAPHGSVDAVLTDPPYGVSYVGKTSDALVIQNDGKADLRGLLQDALGAAFAATRPGSTWYVAAPAGPQFLDFAQVLTDLGVWRQTLVWVKSALVMGHSDFHYRHESIFYGWTPGAAHVQPSDRKQDTVWEFTKPSRSTEHPTMKPIALYARMLEHSTQPRGTVLDPFAGSGTTLMACEQMGRVCRAIEIDPRYCDVVVRRWEAMTGKVAERNAATDSPG